MQQQQLKEGSLEQDNLTSGNRQKSRRKEVIKIRSEINETGMKKIIVKINKTKTWFFEKIKKIDEPLTGKEKNEKGSNKLEIKSYNRHHKIQRITREYYKQVSANKTS